MEAQIEHHAIYTEPIRYTKANGTEATIQVPFFEIPAGTLLFRGVQLPNPKKDEDPRMFVRDWLGYPSGDRFCMTPVHNTFFYTSPYVPFGAHTVGEWFNAIIVYQTTRNLKVVAMISPSPWVRGGKEIKSLDGTAPIQRCDKFDYSCLEEKTSKEARKEKELKAFDNCIRPEFAQGQKLAGWMAIADYDSLDNFKEGLHGKDTTMGKYIMELESHLKGKGIELLTSTYTDGSNHRGFPEIVLFPWSPHPGTENQYTEARTEEDAADAIAEMSDRFNYLPIACITERGILEAFSGDFKAADLPAYASSAAPGKLTRKAIDSFLAKYLDKLQTTGVTIGELGTTRMKFDSRTGFYKMDLFQPALKFQDSSVAYESFCFPLTTQEERDRVTEYKIKYRTFDAKKLLTGDTLISEGPPIYRAFVFERPDELLKQYKELSITFPSTFIPYLLSATERYQRNRYNRILADNPRGAEEALRKADDAKKKIQESLKLLAKKKAEREGREYKEEEEEESKTPKVGPSAPANTGLPAVLQGKQTSIPVLRDMKDAISIGKAALKNDPHSDRDTIMNQSERGIRQSYRRPWDMNVGALLTTMEYIYEFVYNTCYMLCIVNNEPYLFKLEPRGMNPKIKGILEQEIAAKGITDIDLDNTRIMQCILKPYSQEATTADEWIGFLQNVKRTGYDLPNGVYILGLTDAVIYREDDMEPFGMFTKGLVPLEEKFAAYYFLPIMAYSGKAKYHDIPIPNFDDVFEIKRRPDGTVDENETLGEDVVRDWAYKEENRAVFRGGTTGCGATPETNQRIQLCSKTFLDTLEFEGMLDVGITTVTRQYKMDEKQGLMRVDPSDLQIVEPLTIAQQSNYKYIIHIDGNVHAYRLLKTMLTGSCILRVRSPYYGWAEPWLKGFDINDTETDPKTCHYVLVNANFSNLDDVLNWCLDNEEACAYIGANAREQAQRLLNIDTIYATFSNILKFAKFTAYQATQGGGRQPKQKQTRKQRHGGKTKTRKQKRVALGEQLVLAEYRGGGIEKEMEDYIQSTMEKIWSTFARKTKSFS